MAVMGLERFLAETLSGRVGFTECLGLYSRRRFRAVMGDLRPEVKWLTIGLFKSLRSIGPSTTADLEGVSVAV